MNGLQLSESLRAFAELTGDPSLDVLANAVAVGGAEPTSKVVAKIAKYWKATGRVGAHPPALRCRLEAIQAALGSSSAPTSAKDYGAMLKLFTGTASADIPNFVSDLAYAIQTPIPQKPKTTKQPAIDARQLADQLTTLSSDNAAFDAEIAIIESNPRLKKTELQKVAALFLGYERAYKNRADIIKAIRTRQLQDAIQGSRERRGEKIAV